MQGEISTELKAVFKTNMKIFDWDIPENDDRKSAELIIDVMQKAMDELKAEVKAGKYDQY
jgi:ribosomal protein S2